MPISSRRQRAARPAGRAKATLESYRRSEFARFNKDQGVDWLAVLDFIRERCAFVEDKQLASHLNVPPSTLSSVRHAKAELSMMAKYKILDRFGFHLIADATEILMADELAAKARRAAHRKNLESGTRRSPKKAKH